MLSKFKVYQTISTFYTRPHLSLNAFDWQDLQMMFNLLWTVPLLHWLAVNWSFDFVPQPLHFFSPVMLAIANACCFPSFCCRLVVSFSFCCRFASSFLPSFPFFITRATRALLAATVFCRWISNCRTLSSSSFFAQAGICATCNKKNCCWDLIASSSRAFVASSRASRWAFLAASASSRRALY